MLKQPVISTLRKIAFVLCFLSFHTSLGILWANLYFDGIRRRKPFSFQMKVGCFAGKKKKRLQLITLTWFANFRFALSNGNDF